MKIGTRSWNFRADLSSGRLDLEGLISVVAQMGLDGVELLGRHFPRFNQDLAKRYSKLATNMGIEIPAYALENDFAHPSERVRRAEVDTVCWWIQTAGLAGVPFVKIFTGDRQPAVSEETQRLWVLDALRVCADYATAYGVKVLVENHSTICFTYQELAALVEEVGQSSCQICPDVYNFSKLKAEEIVYEAAKVLIPKAPYSHLQFYEIAADGHELHMDIPRLLDIYKQCGYTGYLVLEWEGNSDPYQMVSITSRYVRQLLG